MIKLIAFDIDGTSINHLRKVDPETLSFFKEYHKKGYQFIPTTGRSLDGIPQSMLDLGIMDYAVSSNGARVTNLKTGEDIFAHLLSPERAAELIDLIKPYNVRVTVHANGVCYDTGRFQRFGRKILFHSEFEETPIVRDLATFIRENELMVEKIQLFSLSRKRLMKLQRKLDEFKDISYPMSSSNYFEVTKKGANKGRALTYLSGYLEIPLNEILVIGDDSNDIAMFKVIENSIAMENASERVKNYAKFVGFPNRKGGFSKSIIAYFEKYGV
ncbi:MAG: HAD family hydrolase [Erysipelothrix sp.]